MLMMVDEHLVEVSTGSAAVAALITRVEAAPEVNSIGLKEYLLARQYAEPAQQAQLDALVGRQLQLAQAPAEATTWQSRKAAQISRNWAAHFASAPAVPAKLRALAGGQPNE